MEQEARKKKESEEQAERERLERKEWRKGAIKRLKDRAKGILSPEEIEDERQW